MGRQENGQGKELLTIKSLTPYLMAWACMADNGTDSFLFIDVVTADKSLQGFLSAQFQAKLQSHWTAPYGSDE